MKKTFGALCFVAIGLLLSVPALASEVQSDGLTLNSKAFIDSHFEFTEETQATLTLIITENTVTAITLAQDRSMDSANNYNSNEVLTLDNSVAKLSPMKHFEVGWQTLSSYN